MSGWYKQQRNISERPWFKDADVVQLYTYLKATAYVTDGKYEGYTIRRGSCPTTRPDMMEATGLSYKKVDRCLKVLLAYKEIIVKGYYKFSIITICDYDVLGTENDIFDAYLVRQRYDKGSADGSANDTAHLSTIEYKKEDILISPNSPYKKEREMGDLGLEAKKLYNKTFDGVLPPCVRLSTSTRLMVKECLGRFGRQSVDMVFEQIMMERFSQGVNKTGFIANFTFIFTPKNYQHYLERAMLRQRKAEKAEAEPQRTGQDATRCGEKETARPAIMSFEERLKNLREFVRQHPDNNTAAKALKWMEQAAKENSTD